MPLKVSKPPPSFFTARRSRTITAILSLGGIILSPYSRYAKKGLVYVTLASPLS